MNETTGTLSGHVTPNHRRFTQPLRDSRRVTLNGAHAISPSKRRVRRIGNFSTQLAGDAPSAPKLRLGHVHIKVRDLNRSVPFYIQILGFKLTEFAGRYAFLTTGKEHHSIALEEIGTWAIRPASRAVGVAHVGYEVTDRASFQAMRSKLRKARITFSSRNNGISWTLNFKDPDGNDIQIYLDRRQSPGGAQLWKGRWYGPFHLEEESPSPFAPASIAPKPLP